MPFAEDLTEWFEGDLSLLERKTLWTGYNY